ncbi:MAG: FAD-dependent oxidoreductase, partial [Sedimenticolaceae bacterium]
MSKLVEVKVPDIGDFSDVDVIDVLVSVGDRVAVDDALITLESDKASMDIPSPQAGVVREMKISVGDKASEGTLVCMLEAAGAAAAAAPAQAQAPTGVTAAAGSSDMQCEMLVLGAGPGGYTAAFRAADLGMKTVLVERWDTLGGVCLNVGCIPSKALLHAAKVIDESEDMGAHGIKFAKPEVDIDALRSWKEKVVARLTGGLAGLAKQRKVEVLRGVGAFVDPHHIEVVGGDGSKTLVKFDKAVIAAGSEAVKLPFVPDDPRVIDSTGALALEDVPTRMLVIGGGIIGLEMATVYASLGSRITVVEMLDGIVAGADKDVIKPLFNRIKKRYEAILLKTRVTAVESTPEGMRVTFDGVGAPAEPQ